MAEPLRLHLNAFRGEPAISGFGWHFTSTHSSSHTVALVTGSDLHSELIGASSWPWVAHPVSGLIYTTLDTSHPKAGRPTRLIRTRFRYGSTSEMLNLATQINSSAHSSIGTPLPRSLGALTACKHTVSGLFHSPSGVLFTFPSRY